jgi:hypothetical protein
MDILCGLNGKSSLHQHSSIHIYPDYLIPTNLNLFEDTVVQAMPSPRLIYPRPYLPSTTSSGYVDHQSWQFVQAQDSRSGPQITMLKVIRTIELGVDLPRQPTSYRYPPSQINPSGSHISVESSIDAAYCDSQ